MAETTIGNLTAGAVDGTTLLEQERTVSGSQVSEKVTSSSLANFVGTSHQFAGLNTDVKTLVGAINEAAESGGASVIQLTSAEYSALTSEEKMNGSIYKLTDKAVMMCLDEEYHAVKELLSADYDALTSAQKNNGTIYIKTDEDTTAEDIPIEAGSSTSVKDAIDTSGTSTLSIPRGGLNSIPINYIRTGNVTIISSVFTFPTISETGNIYIDMENSDITLTHYEGYIECDNKRYDISRANNNNNGWVYLNGNRQAANSFSNKTIYIYLIGA